MPNYVIFVLFSPSSNGLPSLEHIKNYLASDGTCKCGLECPLQVEKSFNFNPHVASQQWSPDKMSCNEDLTKLCNHKRKIMAMVTLQNSASLQRTFGETPMSQAKLLESLAKRGNVFNFLYCCHMYLTHGIQYFE